MSPLQSGRHVTPYRQQHYMDEIKRSLDESCPDRVIDFRFGSIRVPTWKFEENTDATWIVTDVENPPYEQEAHVELIHEEGYETAHVVIHLPSGTITSAEISEHIKDGLIDGIGQD